MLTSTLGGTVITDIYRSPKAPISLTTFHSSPSNTARFSLHLISCYSSKTELLLGDSELIEEHNIKHDD